MAAKMLLSSKSLAGARFTMVERAPVVKQVTNGSKYFMRRKGSFMVEVNVSDQETEDQAVKRYMRAVLQSGVLNKLRARRTKETKIEMKKRRLAERAQARKLGIEEPSWEELYGNGVGEEGNPFDEFFCKPGDDDEAYASLGAVGDMPVLDDLYGYATGSLTDVSGSSRVEVEGGYIADQQQQQGGYAAAGQQ